MGLNISMHATAKKDGIFEHIDAPPKFVIYIKPLNSPASLPRDAANAFRSEAKWSSTMFGLPVVLEDIRYAGKTSVVPSLLSTEEFLVADMSLEVDETLRSLLLDSES